MPTRVTIDDKVKHAMNLHDVATHFIALKFYSGNHKIWLQVSSTRMVGRMAHSHIFSTFPSPFSFASHENEKVWILHKETMHSMA
jgi:hypothetical protein